MTPGTISDEALLQERQDNLLAAIWQDGKGFGYATLDISSGRFRLSEPADRETMAAELQRTNPAELLYAEDFAEMALIEGRRGLRRRPLWEFEIDTARQQLNLQFGTRDLIGFGVENAPARAMCRRLPVAVREGYAAYRPAPYPFNYHGASAGQHHHGCRHAPQPGDHAEPRGRHGKYAGVGS